MKRSNLFLATLTLILLAAPALAQPSTFDWEPPRAVSVDFDCQQSAPKAGEVISFLAIFHGTPTADALVTWSFKGDPTPVVGNPVSRTFAYPGNMGVEVQVSQTGFEPIGAAKVVVVAPAPKGVGVPDPPFPPAGAVTITFETQPAIGRAGDPVSFIAVFKGSPTAGALVTWTFPSGEVLYGNPVAYTFSTAGNKLVNVSVEQSGAKPVNGAKYVSIAPRGRVVKM
jgi:hypothetical protein